MESKTGDTTEARFVNAWDAVAKIVHKIAVDKGFWNKGQERNKGEALCLIHSEISEALESMRNNDAPDQHLPKRAGTTVELADAVIRIMDFAKGYGYTDLAEVIMEKIRYNSTRPVKHGKEF